MYMLQNKDMNKIFCLQKLGDAKPQPQQAITTKPNICIKGEKPLACVVAEDVIEEI